MLILINRDLCIEKEKDGMYHAYIPLNFDLHHISLSKEDAKQFYFSFERGHLFILDKETNKMYLRGEISSKDQLKDKVIRATWCIYNPPHKKSFYY